MYNNDLEIIKYVMEALEEGISTQEIREEVFRLAHEGSLIRPLP